MHKQIFFLSLTLLASLQLFGSSSSSNCATTQVSTKKTSLEKLILDFFAENANSELNIGYMSRKELDKFLKTMQQAQDQTIKPLLALLTPCDPKNVLKHVAQYQTSIERIQLEVQAKTVYNNKYAKYAAFKSFAETVYDTEEFDSYQKKALDIQQKILKAYTAYNHQMRKHNIDYNSTEAQKTVENYHKQRIKYITNELNKSFEFQQEFIGSARTMLEEMAKGKPKYEKRLKRIKKMSDFPKDDSGSSSDSSSSDTDGYY